MANIEKLKQNLLREGFQVSCFETAQEACAYLNGAIDGVSVGFGGSQTVRDMGLYEQLSAHNRCYWHWDPATQGIPAEATNADVYISSLNGVSEDGELINIDGRGNRVASTLFGHKKFTLSSGSTRSPRTTTPPSGGREAIAAPMNAKRLEKKDPCVQTGRCMNCSSPGASAAVWSSSGRSPCHRGDGSGYRQPVPGILTHPLPHAASGQRKEIPP